MPSALQVIRATGAGETIQSEVQRKYDEYEKISRNYGILIETTWDISWQDESIIRKYIDCLNDDIDRLPDIVKMP